VQAGTVKERKDINLDQSSQFSRDLAKEDPWVSYGRYNQTAKDKSIILKGTVLVVSI